MRVLLTCFAHDSHRDGLVVLGRALEAAGHRVRVAVPRDLAGEVAAAGLDAVPVDGSAPVDPDLRRGPWDVGGIGDDAGYEDALGRQTMLSARCLARINGDAAIDGAVGLARDWRPDLVVWDSFTLAGSVAAHVVGAAHARLLRGPDVVGVSRRDFLALSAGLSAHHREDPVGEWLEWTLDRHGRPVDEGIVEELVYGHLTLAGDADAGGPWAAEAVSRLEHLAAERTAAVQGSYSGDIAELYDLVHQGKGKDYAGESADLADLVRKYAPTADSLLDVACGTGLHLMHLADHFATVEGLELSADMLGIARRRNPDTGLHEADMRDFALGRRYSAVTCMFSSIGHMADQDELDRAIGRFAAHVEPDGVVVVEPWWFPETFTPGYVGRSLVQVGETTISRVSHSVLEDGATRITVHYLVAAPDSGIAHHEESHRITLFTREQYELAFERAGMSVDHLSGGPSGRGLFVAVPRA